MEQVTTATRLSIGPSEETHGSFTFRVDPTATLSITGLDSKVRRYLLKNGRAGRTENELEQRPRRDYEHKSAGLQGSNVHVDRDEPARRDRVGAAQSAGVQHGPLSARAVRGLPRVRRGPGTPGSEVATPSGGSPQPHAARTARAPRLTYNPDKRKWAREET